MPRRLQKRWWKRRRRSALRQERKRLMKLKDECYDIQSLPSESSWMRLKSFRCERPAKDERSALFCWNRRENPFSAALVWVCFAPFLHKEPFNSGSKIYRFHGTGLGKVRQNWLRNLFPFSLARHCMFGFTGPSFFFVPPGKWQPRSAGEQPDDTQWSQKLKHRYKLFSFLATKSFPVQRTGCSICKHATESCSKITKRRHSILSIRCPCSPGNLFAYNFHHSRLPDKRS